MLLIVCVLCFFFFKQKTAYEMRISDWSSDVCSSDLHGKRDASCGAAPGGLNTSVMLKALSRAFSQTFDPAFRRVFNRSLLYSLVTFVTVWLASWFALDWAGDGLVAWVRNWAGDGFWVGVLQWLVDLAATGAIAVARTQ